jgi:hypothetical protein
MALAKCRECRSELPNGAKYCTHCGVAQRIKSTRMHFLYGLAVLLASPFIFGFLRGNPPASLSSKSTIDERDRYLIQHAGEPKALDDRFGDEAQVACSIGADEFLRSIASYDFKWDDNATGLFGTKFDKFSLNSPGTGMLSLISTRAKLSNGFGAFQQFRFYCLYNVGNGRVVRFSTTDLADEATSPPETTSFQGSAKTSDALPTQGLQLPAQDADLMPLTKYPPIVDQVVELDNECRGGNHTIDDAVCLKRDRLGTQLGKIGWCYGRPGDYPADRYWHRCVETGITKMPERQAKLVNQCTDALKARETDIDVTTAGWPSTPNHAANVVFTQPADDAPGPDLGKLSGPKLDKALAAYEAAHANVPDLTLSFDVRDALNERSHRTYAAICSFKNKAADDRSLQLLNYSVANK